jgi:hypothetical protein
MLFPLAALFLDPVVSMVQRMTVEAVDRASLFGPKEV